MYRELNPASQAAIDVNDFATAYREAERDRDAALARTRLRRATPTSSGGATVVAGADRDRRPVAFGQVEADLELPYDDGGIAWDPSLVFPGLRSGEHLESQIELAPRAPILAADGTPLAEGHADAREHPLGSAAIDVTGEVGDAPKKKTCRRWPGRASRPTPRSGSAASSRPSTPGSPASRAARCSPSPTPAARRASLAQAEPKPGAPVKTTIDPDLQESRGLGAGRALRRHRRARRPQRRRPGARRPGLLRPPAARARPSR